MGIEVFEKRQSIVNNYSVHSRLSCFFPRCQSSHFCCLLGRHELPQRQDMIHGQGLSSMQSMYSSEMQMPGHGIIGPGLQMSSQGRKTITCLFAAPRM